LEARMLLRVERLPAEDAWKDIVRIPRAYRKDAKGRRIPRGTICRISLGKISRWVVVHGLDSKDPVIAMDTNVKLGLSVYQDEQHSFTIERISWLTSFWFPWKASDPIYRLPAQLGLIALILGVVLGVTGILIGLIPIYAEHHKAAIHHSSEPSAVPKAAQQGSK
jgi:hypothetical protein